MSSREKFLSRISDYRKGPCFVLNKMEVGLKKGLTSILIRFKVIFKITI